MASRTVVSLLDDIDGSDADETVKFGLDGTLYEIDLNTKHAEKLRAALAEYVSHARRVRAGNVVSIGTARSAGKKMTRQAERELSKAIRDWAKSKGVEMADRGRIPEQVVTAYEANDPTMLPGHKAPASITLAFSEGASEATPVKAAKKATKATKTTKAAAPPAAKVV